MSYSLLLAVSVRFLARTKNVATMRDFHSSVFRTKSGNSAFSGDSGDFSLNVPYMGRKL